MATLKAVYASLFPDDPAVSRPFARAPRMPTDIFAFVAHVLERSGAYHHIAPDVSGEDENEYRRIVVDDAMRTEAARVGKVWRTTPLEVGRRLPKIPDEVEALWQSLESHGDATVFLLLDGFVA